MSSNTAENLEIVTLPETGFVKQVTILKLIPVGKSTWWRWVNSGKAPKPVKLGPQTTVWRVEEIRALIEELGQGAE